MAQWERTTWGGTLDRGLSAEQEVAGVGALRSVG